MQSGDTQQERPHPGVSKSNFLFQGIFTALKGQKYCFQVLLTGLWDLEIFLIHAQIILKIYLLAK